MKDEGIKKEANSLNNTVVSTNRIQWIDNAKGIAILLVILAHVNSTFSFAFGFHLVVFFLLCGYTLKLEVVTKSLLRKKFRRLMIPYFYTCFAVIAMDIVNDVLVYHKASIESVTHIIGIDLIRSFFASGSISEFGGIDIGSRIGAIWFLPALFFSILFCHLIVNYTKNSFKAGVASVSIAIIGMITARFIWLPFSIQSAMFALPFVWAGYGARQRKLLDKLHWYHYLIAQVILIVGIRIGYSELWFVTANLKDVFLSPVIGLSGCLMVILVAKLYKGNALAYLGRQSLVIMCAHVFALETMGAYFVKILDITGMSGGLRIACGTMMQVVFPIMVAVILDRIRSIGKKKEGAGLLDNENTGDNAIDVVKGICIILMVIGHYIPSGILRDIIFSFHMMAFVFFSGYFYNSKRRTTDAIKHMLNGFIKPYAVAAILAVLLSHDSWGVENIIEKGLQYIMGMSFADRVFTSFESVGPIYFMLFLFAVRLIYLLVDHWISREYVKWIAVVGLALLGIVCGAKGYWLPWSLDIACYALIFYKMGVCFRENGFLLEIRGMPVLYFVMAPIWAYMIYSGSMEIAIRNYGQYALTVIGSICGILLIYMLSSYIWNNVRFVGKVLALTGRASLYILVVHTVIRGMINSFVSQRFDPLGFPYLVATSIIQLVLAVAVYCAIYSLKIKMKESAL